jgi:hypothetical protein
LPVIGRGQLARRGVTAMGCPQLFDFSKVSFKRRKAAGETGPPNYRIPLLSAL